MQTATGLSSRHKPDSVVKMHDFGHEGNWTDMTTNPHRVALFGRWITFESQQLWYQIFAHAVSLGNASPIASMDGENH
jgi:hypothetical protein